VRSVEREFTGHMREAADPHRDPPWAELPVIGTDYRFPQGLLDEMLADRTRDTLAGLTIPSARLPRIARRGRRR
jgi:hypothetical protein